MQNKRIWVLCRIRGFEYYSLISTIFGTRTQNVKHADFSSSACFSLPGN